MIKRNAIKFLLVSFAILGLLSACGKNEPVPTADAEDLFEDFVPVVSATGKVVPHEWATLSVPSAGIVEEIFIEENEEVDKGDSLLQIGGEEVYRSSITAANLELISAQQALDDLIDNAGLSLAEAEQALAQARDQVRLAENRVSDLTTPNDPADVKEAYARLILAKDKYDKAKKYFRRFENKSEDNVNRAGAQAALSAAKREYENALTNYNWLSGTAGEIAIALGEADLAYAQAALENARNYLDEIGDGPHPDALALAKARVENAQAQLAAAQTALDDLKLTAPFDGTITQIFVRENEWVNPGQAIIVIGNLSKLQVETTDLSEIDVARLQVGDKATITFDALPDVVANGEIAQIATKSSPGSGVNYAAIITFDEIPEGLLWDMTAFVDIQIK